jgi:hypothetical protein
MFITFMKNRVALRTLGSLSEKKPQRPFEGAIWSAATCRLFWDHPDNRGWSVLFSRWARSTRLREVWRQSRHTFGIRFEYFCGERLGMETSRPVMRV